MTQSQKLTSAMQRIAAEIAVLRDNPAGVRTAEVSQTETTYNSRGRLTSYRASPAKTIDTIVYDRKGRVTSFIERITQPGGSVEAGKFTARYRATNGALVSLTRAAI